jgi:hypothetical protein
VRKGNAGDIDGPVCLLNTDAPPWFQLGRNEIQKYGAAPAASYACGTDRACCRSFRERRNAMLRFLLVLAVIAVGADALLNNGAYTQAAWRELSSIKINADGGKLSAARKD